MLRLKHFRLHMADPEALHNSDGDAPPQGLGHSADQVDRRATLIPASQTSVVSDVRHGGPPRYFDPPIIGVR